MPHIPEHVLPEFIKSLDVSTELYKPGGEPQWVNKDVLHLTPEYRDLTDKEWEKYRKGNEKIETERKLEQEEWEKMGEIMKKEKEGTPISEYIETETKKDEEFEKSMENIEGGYRDLTKREMKKYEKTIEQKQIEQKMGEIMRMDKEGKFEEFVEPYTGEVPVPKSDEYDISIQEGDTTPIKDFAFGITEIDEELPTEKEFIDIGGDKTKISGEVKKGEGAQIVGAAGQIASTIAIGSERDTAGRDILGIGGGLAQIGAGVALGASGAGLAMALPLVVGGITSLFSYGAKEKGEKEADERREKFELEKLKSRSATSVQYSPGYLKSV